MLGYITSFYTKSISATDMKLHIICLLSSINILLFSCAKKESGISTADMIGGWQRVEPAPKKNRFGGFNPGWMDNWLSIREVNSQLFMSSYQGHHILELNAVGDTVTLIQGCLSFATPVAISRGPERSGDTLSILPYGKYVRMRLTDFDRGRKAFIDARQLRKPL